MSEEEYTPEESKALEEMQAEPSEAVSEPETEATADTEAAADTEAVSEHEAKEPEFKSSRTDKPPEGFVPHAAMHAERENRKRVEAELAKMQEWREAQEAKVATPKPEYVDPLEDPEAHRRWEEHRDGELKSRLDAMEASNEQQMQSRQRAADAGRLEREFTATTPDYADAAKYLHESRVTLLRGQGYGDAEIQSQIADDANAIFDAARTMGMNPAQMVYYRAQSAGYAKGADTKDIGSQITARETAQRETRGLGSAGGGEQSGRLTAMQLSEMSEDQLAKVSADDIRAAMGG